MKSKILVEIVFALPEFQYLEKILVKNGSKLGDALKYSKINVLFPDIDFLNENFFGIFGKKCGINHLLSDGDRIEIYRNLIRNVKNRRYIKIKSF